MTQIISSSQITTLPIKYDALAHLSITEAAESECIIFNEDDKTLSLLTTNNIPDKFHAIVDRFHEQWYKVNAFFTDSIWFQKALQWYDQREIEKERLFQIQQQKIHAEGQWAIQLLQEIYEKRQTFNEWWFLQEILRLAFQAWASDVHFQTEEYGVYMRIRKDGILQPIFSFTHEEFNKYVMKLKFMAWVKMNVGNHSQDGRFQTTVNKDWKEIHIDIRASFLPSLRGDSIVLRFLDATSGVSSLAWLGMAPRHCLTMDDQLTKHHGLILITWPTGSWKTTTVYTLLHQLNQADRKIITLEDPVEYEIWWITQSQINEDAWYTFEEWLKWILRHDPDIIVVGEIRTLESAQLAINAAITGHLVISTVHTNNAVEAISRLLNMGIPPFMLTASLNCIIWQRLLRKAVNPVKIDTPEMLIPYVKGLETRFKKVLPNESFPKSASIYEMNTTLWWPGASYAWRIGAFECVVMNPTLKQAVLDGKTSIELQKIVDEFWFLSMKDDARIKMLKQETTIEEIERVV